MSGFVQLTAQNGESFSNNSTVGGSGNFQYLVNSSTNIEIDTDAIMTIYNSSSIDVYQDLGSGFNSTVSTLAIDSDNNVYAGGAFTFAGDVSANRIAKWDGSTWSSFGTGFNSTVNALAIDANNVYAGGSFTTACGLSANCIAKLVTSGIIDISINNNYVTTLVNNQYQCVNYYNSNGYIYKTANGYR